MRDGDQKISILAIRPYTPILAIIPMVIQVTCYWTTPIFGEINNFIDTCVSIHFFGLISESIALDLSFGKSWVENIIGKPGFETLLSNLGIFAEIVILIASKKDGANE